MTANAITRATAALLFCMAALVSGPAQAQNYDGAGLLRFGVFGQVGHTTFDIDVRELPEVRGSTSDTAFGGGVTFGYDYLFGNGMILGIEGDIGLDTADAGRNFRDFSTNFMASIRGRIGGYVSPHLLLYATGGVAFLGVEYDGLRDELTGFRFSKDDTLTGWMVGGGAEFDWHGIVFFGEYLYASYDSFSFTEVVDETDPMAPAFRNDIDLDQHLFRFGVKFIIGHDHRVGEAYLPSLK